MEPATWVIGTVVAVALLHLLLVGYLARRRKVDAAPIGERGGESATNVADQGDDTVRCRECGAENERGYRYCRYCVAELPGGSPLQNQPGSPIGVR